MPPAAATSGSVAWAVVDECAVMHLASDLETDDEEEDGHQHVVDQEVQREAPGQSRRVPEVLVACMPARVGEGERDGRGGEERDTARRLDPQELVQRLQQARDACHGHTRPCISATMQKLLNLKVKFRESFRPFAPSVLREYIADWFELEEETI